MLNQDSSCCSLSLLKTGSRSSVSEARLSAWLAFRRWSENCANASMATISICLLASILLSISGPKADCINEIVSSLLIEGNGALLVSMSSFTVLLSPGDVSLSEIDTRELQNNEVSIRFHIYYPSILGEIKTAIFETSAYGELKVCWMKHQLCG